MAYSNISNLTGGVETPSRSPIEKMMTHRWFSQHLFDTQILTTAVSLNELIVKQDDSPGVLLCRSHVEISNTHATANLFVLRARKNQAAGGLVASSTVYQYKLVPATGYVKIPLVADMDLSIISDVNGIGAVITELG